RRAAAAGDLDDVGQRGVEQRVPGGRGIEHDDPLVLNADPLRDDQAHQLRPGQGEAKRRRAVHSAVRAQRDQDDLLPKTSHESKITRGARRGVHSPGGAARNSRLRAKRCRERSTIRSTTGRTTAYPSAPRVPPGISRSSYQVRVEVRTASSLSVTSNAPVPRTTLPVWRTTQRFGGSHSVTTMVSRKPSGPTPVNASIRPPTPRPSPSTVRTFVAVIHELCDFQSVSAAQTSSAPA